MNLQNFEKKIDSKILKRGEEYFNNENIGFIEETKKNIWEADVSGTDDYQVKIKLGFKDEIKEWDNPYYGFPQMIRFAFNPNESSRKKMEEMKRDLIHLMAEVRNLAAAIQYLSQRTAWSETCFNFNGRNN